MKWGKLAALLLSGLLTAGVNEQAGAEPTQNHRLTILVSIDGFRADYLDRSITPTLSSLAESGVKGSVRPSYPSVTFPNHYTLITGKTPDHHGLVANLFDNKAHGVRFSLMDPEGARNPVFWTGAKPIWASAEEQGKVTVHMFWPAIGVDSALKPPKHFQPFIPGTDVLDEPQMLMELVTSTGKPVDFATLYFYDLDSAGHKYGPNSSEVNETLKRLDAAIARLVESLKESNLWHNTNLIITSDHGMTDSPRGNIIVLEDILAPDQFEAVGLYTNATIRPANGTPLSELSSALVGRHEHMECWLKENIPARFGYGSNENIAPVVCLAEPGWLIVTKEIAANLKEKGSHGYDPYSKEMAAVFIAAGPAFRADVELEPFDNVDIYPLLVKLIGIQGEPGDGDLTVLQQALK